jgi:hypothetical protein
MCIYTLCLRFATVREGQSGGHRYTVIVDHPPEAKCAIESVHLCSMHCSTPARSHRLTSHIAAVPGRWPGVDGDDDRRVGRGLARLHGRLMRGVREEFSRCENTKGKRPAYGFIRRFWRRRGVLDTATPSTASIRHVGSRKWQRPTITTFPEQRLRPA